MGAIVKKLLVLAILRLLHSGFLKQLQGLAGGGVGGVDGDINSLNKKKCEHTQ